MNDINFIVDKEKRIIICELKNCRNIAIRRIRKYISPFCSILLDSRYSIPDMFCGLAKCSIEDVWDEEYGKKLALNRAKRKRCIAVNNCVRKFASNLMKECENLTVYGVHTLPKNII